MNTDRHLSRRRRRTHERQAISLFRKDIVERALLDSFIKLDPRVQVRNPVMFVVEIGAVITTVTWLIQVVRRQGARAATTRPGTRSRSRSGCG